MATSELPFNWAPRWTNGYYDGTSKIQKLYASGLLYHINESQRIAAVSGRFSFWGETWQPRSAFVAKYDKRENHIPQILIENTLVSNQIETLEVKCHKTLGDFLFEYSTACYYFDGKLLLLRNLPLVTFSVTSSSGTIDLSSNFSQHNPVDDSPFVVIDSDNYASIIDPQDSRVSETSLYIEDGDYTLKYLSVEVWNHFSSGGLYITIDGERVFISPLDLKNVWDDYAGLFGFVREDRETNLSLQSKCQQLSLVSKPDLMAGAMLGQTQFILWDTSTSLDLSASGIVSIEPINLTRTLKIDEYPEKDNNTYRLSFTPDGTVQLFYNTVSVPSEEFSVSGSVITPLNNKLLASARGSIRAVYTVSQYSETVSGDFVLSVNRSNDGKELSIVVAGKNLKSETSTKRERLWRWDKELGVRNGASVFN